MREEGYVSLWLGNSKTLEDYNKYIDFKYSEDGDFVPSQFAKDFNISYFDEDFFEVDYFEKPVNDLNHLLEGFSYDDIILPKFQNLLSGDLSHDINSVILLYNFKYDGNKMSTNSGPNAYNFIGTVTFK